MVVTSDQKCNAELQKKACAPCFKSKIVYKTRKKEGENRNIFKIEKKSKHFTQHPQHREKSYFTTFADQESTINGKFHVHIVGTTIKLHC